jgi:DNA-directed RNA polymerase specialized sigma24 family protein
MARLSEAEREAVGRLWERVQPAIRALKRRHPGLDVDGVAAEMLVLYFPRYEPGSGVPVEAWALGLLRYARGRALELRRPRGYRRRPGPAVYSLEDPRRLADACPASGDLEARDLLDGLHPPDADIFWRHVVEGRTQEELAAEHGLHRCTVQRRIDSCRQALRRRLSRSS